MTPTIITMNETRRGCPDGFKVVLFEAGKSYTMDRDIDRDTAHQFLTRGQARVTQAPTLEEKMADLMGMLRPQRRA